VEHGHSSCNSEEYGFRKHRVRKLGRAQTKALFVHGARLVNERGSLRSVLKDGMEELLWIELCMSLASEASRLTGVATSPTFLRSNPLNVKEKFSSPEQIDPGGNLATSAGNLSDLLPKHSAHA